MKKKIIWFIPLFLVIIILLFVSNNSKLRDYKNMDLSIKNVKGILKYGTLNDKYEDIAINVKSVNITLENGLYTNDYKYLEYDASLLLSLINDISSVTFINNSTSYIFDYETYNNLYTNIKDIDLEVLKNRLDSIPNDKVYLGNVNGTYDLYDISDICEFNNYVIYEDNNYKYNLKCTTVEEIEVIDNNNVYNLKDALKNNLFKAEDLLNKNLNLTKVVK